MSFTITDEMFHRFDVGSAIALEFFCCSDLYEFIEFDMSELSSVGEKYGIPESEINAKTDELDCAASRALDKGREDMLARYGLEATWQGDQPCVSGDHVGRIPEYDRNAFHEWAESEWAHIGDRINAATEAVVREAVAAWSAQ